MKKVYEKPVILFEDFTISTNVAASCENVALLTDGECGVTYVSNDIYNGMIIFLTSVNGCKLKTDDDQFGSLCYHNPSEDNNTFSS